MSDYKVEIVEFEAAQPENEFLEVVDALLAANDSKAAAVITLPNEKVNSASRRMREAGHARGKTARIVRREEGDAETKLTYVLRDKITRSSDKDSDSAGADEQPEETAEQPETGATESAPEPEKPAAKRASRAK